uniref:Uncharacterized protein n=1 Tax=Arundo donax TaxID=35708 RepID=A0A0A8YUY3_ARUDO
MGAGRGADLGLAAAGAWGWAAQRYDGGEREGRTAGSGRGCGEGDAHRRGSDDGPAHWGGPSDRRR